MKNKRYRLEQLNKGTNMNLTDARTLACELMNKHGLTTWDFHFDNALRRFGCCHWTGHKITLSKHLVQLNDAATVRLTILHEIAHALAGSSAGHGPRWKAIARRLGHNGNRTYAKTVLKPKARYVAQCDCTWGKHELLRMGGTYSCRETGKTLKFVKQR